MLENGRLKFLATARVSRQADAGRIPIEVVSREREN